MSRIVATSKLPVLREFVLHAFELLLGDNGRDRRNRDPVRPRSHAPGRSRRAGTARLLEAPGIDLAGVDRVGQDAAQGLHVPAALNSRGRHPVLVQLLGQAIELRPSSAYQTNISATAAASVGSWRTPAGSRG